MMFYFYGMCHGDVGMCHQERGKGKIVPLWKTE
jgi:hypothetical protein